MTPPYNTSYNHSMKKETAAQLIEINRLFVAATSTMHLLKWQVFDIILRVFQYWYTYIFVKQRMMIVLHVLYLCKIIGIQVNQVYLVLSSNVDHCDKVIGISDLNFLHLDYFSFRCKLNSMKIIWGVDIKHNQVIGHTLHCHEWPVDCHGT